MKPLTELSLFVKMLLILGFILYSAFMSALIIFVIAKFRTKKFRYKEQIAFIEGMLKKYPSRDRYYYLQYEFKYLDRIDIDQARTKELKDKFEKKYSRIFSQRVERKAG